jgi:integrase
MIGCPPLSSKQLRNTLQNLRGRYRWRNRCLVVLGTTTGLRVSELLALKIEDVWTGTAPRPRIYVARRHTKGKRQGDSIVMHSRAAAAITKWLGSRRSFAQQLCFKKVLGGGGGEAFKEAVEVDEEFAHDGDEGDFVGLASGAQALVDGL